MKGIVLGAAGLLGERLRALPNGGEGVGSGAGALLDGVRRVLHGAEHRDEIGLQEVDGLAQHFEARAGNDGRPLVGRDGRRRHDERHIRARRVWLATADDTIKNAEHHAGSLTSGLAVAAGLARCRCLR